MRRLASIVAAALDELGFPRVDVLGYSFGGAVAQQLAHDSPGRVRRRVLAATICGVGGRLARANTLNPPSWLGLFDADVLHLGMEQPRLAA